MIAPFGLLAPGKILFGRGRAAEAPDLIAACGRKVFVTHGRSPERGLWLARALKAKGASVLTHACPGEPTIEQLDEALAAARGFGAEVVAAIGGGSAIDLGKAVAALLPADGDPLDHFEVVGKGLPLAVAPLPFVAMPTTSGTGAEATRNAVIGVPAHRRKVSLRDDRMIPHIAIVDPALTDATPRAITLASGLDAITQVIEPYLCTRPNPFTDALCRPAIPAGIAALTSLMEDEYEEARDAMAWVSLVGGMALTNAGLGAVHGLAGVIGGITGSAHGALCGTLMPHVLWLHAARHDGNTITGIRVAEVAMWLSAAFGAGDGIGALETWIHENGLPRLSALGLSPLDHEEVAKAAQLSSSMKADPTGPTSADLADILLAAG
jgi:alcohol dehydrogenase class IV